MKGTYLWVSLDALHRLLLGLALARGVLGLQSLGLLLLNLTGVLAVVVHHGLCAHVHALAVLFHDKVGLSLAQVRADELGVELESLVAVLNGRWESEKLDVAGSAVGVSSWVLRRALDHLRVGLDSCGPVCLLELGISKLASLLGLLRVDVRLPILLDLRLLCCSEFSENFRCAVFRLGFLVESDGVGKVALPLICGTNASVRPERC